MSTKISAPVENYRLVRGKTMRDAIDVVAQADKRILGAPQAMLARRASSTTKDFPPNNFLTTLSAIVQQGDRILITHGFNPFSELGYMLDPQPQNLADEPAPHAKTAYELNDVAFISLYGGVLSAQRRVPVLSANEFLNASATAPACVVQVPFSAHAGPIPLEEFEASPLAHAIGGNTVAAYAQGLRERGKTSVNLDLRLAESAQYKRCYLRFITLNTIGEGGHIGVRSFTPEWPAQLCEELPTNGGYGRRR